MHHPNPADVATSNKWWWDGAERAITWLAQTGSPFTSDDVRQLGVPEPDHANRIGAAFLVAEQRGLIERVGDTISTRRSRRGGRLSIWVGTPKAQHQADAA